MLVENFSFIVFRVEERAIRCRSIFITFIFRIRVELSDSLFKWFNSHTMHYNSLQWCTIMKITPVTNFYIPNARATYPQCCPTERFNKTLPRIISMLLNIPTPTLHHQPGVVQGISGCQCGPPACRCSHRRWGSKHRTAREGAGIPWTSGVFGSPASWGQDAADADGGSVTRLEAPKQAAR